MGLRAMLIGSFVVVIATMHGCAPRDDDASATESERIGETTSALTQSLRLPFPSGHTWYICQSYVGFSHKSNRPFDIGWTKASCNGGNNDSGGKPIAAPGAGRIIRMPNTAAGGDFMCLGLAGGGSIVLGHVKPNPGVKLDDDVAAGQVIATVRAANDPAGQNAGIAHLHYEAFAGNNCYVGAAQPFTGAWRMQCAPDLPFNATSGFYNGTAITACAPDAGQAADAGADADASIDGADAASNVAPPAKEDGEASVIEPEPSLTADDGCAIRPSGRAPRAPHAWSLLGIAIAARLVRRRTRHHPRRASAQSRPSTTTPS